MKCQKCGKNEVNFHYSSNVNGCVTEEHLCSECAQASGYDMAELFNTGGFIEAMNLLEAGNPFGRGGMFNEYFPVFGSRIYPAMLQTAGAYAPYPLIARIGNIPQPRPQSCCSVFTPRVRAGKNSCVKSDEKMTERRELNMQLQTAIQKEEYEKAAELRDKIKSLNEKPECGQ